jgi:molecular chaperone DnaK
MLRYMERTQAKHILFFIDACRSVITDSKSGPDLANLSVDVNQLCPSGMVSFCSSSPGQASFESDKFEAGLFTHGIVEAFSEKNRCQTVYELNEFLTRRLPILSKEAGKMLCVINGKGPLRSDRRLDGILMVPY